MTIGSVPWSASGFDNFTYSGTPGGSTSNPGSATLASGTVGEFNSTAGTLNSAPARTLLPLGVPPLQASCTFSMCAFNSDASSTPITVQFKIDMFNATSLLNDFQLYGLYPTLWYVPSLVPDKYKLFTLTTPTFTPPLTAQDTGYSTYSTNAATLSWSGSKRSYWNGSTLQSQPINSYSLRVHIEATILTTSPKARVDVKLFSGVVTYDEGIEPTATTTISTSTSTVTTHATQSQLSAIDGTYITLLRPQG